MVKKILVLISGSGSNLQALIDAKIPDSEIIAVISSSKKAYGIERAEKVGIKTVVHSLYKYNHHIPKDEHQKRVEARNKYDIDLAKIINDLNPDLVVCAGWLLVLGKDFLKDLHNIPIINLHPALPGQFDGTTHAIEMAWNKCQETKKPLIAGCMVHYVVEEVDKGKPIVIRELEINPGTESLDDYETRVHSAEHEIIVEATRKVLGL
ncbi:hypothetical protein TBLA_0D01740 [Henningerozyma blattae CBS 6284]|uniref:Phosphoribosylglycinamide formyltransferase n=1 Tax=Henningerozyma blattae (strain ATCC 34711 / CBS 6284 / DSM 70876 / NBRC 10599 / NRRL Y-10934 / UCD 77-7) TaxID=1071380 RepID=I2H2T0_HENB6|nr:hypothetical protein TBLA_0D01740 [Tetrapisispora blattae CBS 6284]CCH60682.1 hypothetical protein TBLA_0D01740 [Tetrapisispora blattae CBS 6284]